IAGGAERNTHTCRQAGLAATEGERSENLAKNPLANDLGVTDLLQTVEQNREAVAVHARHEIVMAQARHRVGNAQTRFEAPCNRGDDGVAHGLGGATDARRRPPEIDDEYSEVETFFAG